METQILNQLAKFETFESILNRMLSNLPEDVDKSKTSFAYNTLAPMAYELYKMHFQMLVSLNSLFVNSAEDFYLSELCLERGCPRLKARPMIIEVMLYDSEGVTLTNVPVGTHLRNGNEVFVVTSKYNSMYTLESLTKAPIELGSNWEPLDFVEVKFVKLVNITQYGSLLETDEELRERYLNMCMFNPFGGNIGDYKDKIAKLCPEIPYVRIVPRQPEWTDYNVGIYLLNENVGAYKDEELLYYKNLFISKFVPIDHIIHVASPVLNDSTIVRISVTVPQNTNQEEVADQIRKLLRRYTKSFVSEWTSTTYIRLFSAKMTMYILENLPYIQNISKLTLDGSTMKTFSYDEFPSLLEENILVTVEEV